MTRIKINPGVCGLKTTVVIEGKGNKCFSVKVESDCEMVDRLGKEIAELTLMDAFKRIIDNPVYRKGSACLRHVSCPVPSGILKALEVEAGLAVPRDVKIEFIHDEEEN